MSICSMFLVQKQREEMVTKKLSQATLSGKSVGASKPREVRDIPAANINVAEDKPGETTKLIKKESMETVCGAGILFFWHVTCTCRGVSAGMSTKRTSAPADTLSLCLSGFLTC